MEQQQTAPSPMWLLEFHAAEHRDAGVRLPLESSPSRAAIHPSQSAAPALPRATPRRLDTPDVRSQSRPEAPKIAFELPLPCSNQSGHQVIQPAARRTRGFTVDVLRKDEFETL